MDVVKMLEEAIARREAEIAAGADPNAPWSSGLIWVDGEIPAPRVRPEADR